jgi:hypothetical protein
MLYIVIYVTAVDDSHSRITNELEIIELIFFVKSPVLLLEFWLSGVRAAEV